MNLLLASLKINFDVIGVSETWNSFDNPIRTNVQMTGYENFSYKSHSKNGGVALYVKSGLNPISRTDLSKGDDNFETVSVKVENNSGTNYLFCCAYRYPNSDIETFTEYLQGILSTSSILNKRVFILGDFNIDLLNYNSNNQIANYVNFLFSKQFLPYIIHPSRVTGNTSTLIDNIFANITDTYSIRGNTLTQITDHFPQFLIVKHAGISYKNLSYYQHDFTNLNEETLLNDFANINSSYMNDNNLDVNTKFNRLLSCLDDMVKTHAPLKKLTKCDIKFRNKPWINRKIKKMMRIRDQVFRRLQNNNNDPSLRDLYKKLRNRVTNSLKSGKSSYYYNYFQKNSNNKKELWSGIKSIIDIRKSNNINIINKLKDSTGNITSDHAVIANIFNEFFVNVSNNITKNIPRTFKSSMNFMESRVGHSFFTAPSVPSEISDIISLSKLGKSLGPNSIPLKILKILSPVISPLLSQIINESFQTGIFPDKMKLAKVIPLFKKGCVLTASNYRTISLLPIFSKITEKDMYERLYKFLEKYKIFICLPIWISCQLFNKSCPGKFNRSHQKFIGQ